VAQNADIGHTLPMKYGGDPISLSKMCGL